MKPRFRIYQRNADIFYAHDNLTGKRESLNTTDRRQAERLVFAKNEAAQQPALNLQIAKAYLLASDPSIAHRTWQHVMGQVAETKRGVTCERWERAMREKPFDRIRTLTLLETRGEHFIKVLSEGTVSTNTFLRRLHNFALDMNWLPVPVIPRLRWPKIEFQSKRAITGHEHQQILSIEQNPERRLFYQLLWHLGGSQSDIAALRAEDVDWSDRLISFRRMKTGSFVQFHFGDDVAAILKALPSQGYLFPKISRNKESDRAKQFWRSCRRLEIEGITLHSYRYAWAERARSVGYPERFAQEALGHRSEAVHRSYAKKAQVKLPSLEDYEKSMKEKIVPMHPKHESKTVNSGHCV